ncbi:hypothetical protein PCANC_23703 [Puccinia coronata f. sp. avenae]|uniref:Uncharacterized protein n=1 Tax=Puccinia coronata f. sp. avenae TaxID=200324 RepID=A0A2N5UDF8_9BASI|nr:hypothetical protein PCANC_23703 [Puccinia coronata f. sp. avenae]
MFEQENDPLGTQATPNLTHPQDTKEEEENDDSKAEGLYAAWPLLRPIGEAARSAEQLQSLISLDKDHVQFVHHLMQEDQQNGTRTTAV